MSIYLTSKPINMKIKIIARTAPMLNALDQINNNTTIKRNKIIVNNISSYTEHWSEFTLSSKDDSLFWLGCYYWENWKCNN